MICSRVPKLLHTIANEPGKKAVCIHLVFMKKDFHQCCVVHTVCMHHNNPYLLYFSQMISICVGMLKRVHLQFRYFHCHVKVWVFACALSCVYDSMCIVCITMLMFLCRPCMQHSRGVLWLSCNDNGGWDPEWTWDGSQLFRSDHGRPVHCHWNHHRSVLHIIHVHRRHVPVIIIFSAYSVANVNISKYPKVPCMRRISS